MREIEPGTRTFELSDQDVRQAIIEYARKNKRGLSEGGVKFGCYDGDDEPIIVARATVTFNIESDKPAQHPEATQRG